MTQPEITYCGPVVPGPKLALASRDIKKLTSDGCELKLVPEQSNHNDNSDFEDDIESEPYFDEETQTLSRSDNDRLKREYISLVVNANRDPIKPGTKSVFDESRDSRDGETEYFTNSPEESYIGIHKIHDDVGNYDDYMKTNSFVEISPKRVFKKIRVPGVQLPVTEDSLVIYNCALWTQNSKEPFDSTWLRRTALSTYLNTDSILPGIHELLLSTKSNEICEAFIRPEAAFGKLGIMPRIPPNATVFCLLEIVKVITPDKIQIILKGMHGEGSYPVFKEVYLASEEARRRGNYYYNSGQYKIALQRYKSGIRLLESFPFQSDKDGDKADGLLLRLYNNCARASNAAGCPRQALSACRQAADIDDNEPKTYWHKMTAWAKMGHYDKALGVTRRALQLFKDPKESEKFRQKLEEFKKKVAADEVALEELRVRMARALVGSA